MDTPSRNYPPDDQRVSDANRDHAVSELSEAFQAGRITADEFEQRSGRALSARTGKDLTDLFTDLQKDNVPAARTAAGRLAIPARRRHLDRHGRIGRGGRPPSPSSP